jgi:hypothetical protein
MLTSLGGYNQICVSLFLLLPTFRHRYGIGRDQYASGQPEMRSRNRFLHYGCFALVELSRYRSTHTYIARIFRILRKHVAAARQTLHPWLRYLLPRYIGRTFMPRRNNCQGQNPSDAIWVGSKAAGSSLYTGYTRDTRTRAVDRSTRAPSPFPLAASSFLFLSLPSLSSISVHCDDSARLVISL